MGQYVGLQLNLAVLLFKKDGGVRLRWWTGDCVPGHLYGRLLG